MRRLLCWQTMSGLLLSQDQRALVARPYVNLNSAHIHYRWQHLINHWNAQEFNEDMVDMSDPLVYVELLRIYNRNPPTG